MSRASLAQRYLGAAIPFHPSRAGLDFVFAGADWNTATGTWADTSGNARHATQATAGRRPAAISDPFPGAAFTGVHTSSGKYVEGPLVKTRHLPAMLWFVMRSPSSALGTIFTTRETAEISANTANALRIQNDVAGEYLVAGDVNAVGSNGGETKPPANTVRAYKALWTPTERRISDGVGCWAGSDIEQWIAAVATTLAGFRIGCGYHDDGVFLNPFIGDLFWIGGIFGRLLDDNSTTALDRWLDDEYELDGPYRYARTFPTLVTTTTAPTPTIYLASCTNSGWENGFALRVAQDTLGAHLVTVGTQEAADAGGEVMNDGHGGKTWEWFATHADSPLTSATNTLDIAAWLDACEDADGNPHVPTHILWSLFEGVCLNNLVGAVPAAFAAEMVHAEALFAAVDAEYELRELDPPVHIISTPFVGNGRPTSSSGASNWILHATIASWWAARNATIALIVAEFEGREDAERYPIFRFDEPVDPIDGYQENESYGLIAGIHPNQWHGSMQQGAAFAAWARAALWP